MFGCTLILDRKISFDQNKQNISKKKSDFRNCLQGSQEQDINMIFFNNLLKLGQSLVKTKQKQNFLPIPTVYRKNDTNFFSVTIIRIKCK